MSKKNCVCFEETKTLDFFAPKNDNLREYFTIFHVLIKPTLFLVEIKEIEVTGERPDESPSDMKKQRKLQRKKSIDKEELNVSCRALGKADREGWLYKKGTFLSFVRLV